jgi:hypothetical protein
VFFVLSIGFVPHGYRLARPSRILAGADYALDVVKVPRQVAAPRARAVNSPVYKRRCNPIEEKQEKDMNITVHGLHKNDAEAE